MAANQVAGSKRIQKNNVDMLELDPGSEWTRPLRGNLDEIVYVSFHALASRLSSFAVAGARLGLAIHASNGFLQLMYDDSAAGTLQWKGLGIIMREETYSGRILAELPVLTLRIDPQRGVWDLFSDARLIAHDLPLIDGPKHDRRVRVLAGADGAWICGLVVSDENPIYEDSNENAIDDRFEQRRHGVLLSRNLSGPAKQRVVDQWKNDQVEEGAPIFVFKRPLPDRVNAATAPSH